MLQLAWLNLIPEKLLNSNSQCSLCRLATDSGDKVLKLKSGDMTLFSNFHEIFALNQKPPSLAMELNTFMICFHVPNLKSSK